MAFTDDQAQAINAAPNTFGNPRGPGISSWWGGQGVGGPAGQFTGFSGFTPASPPSLWDKLMGLAGSLGKSDSKMPGTTIGAPAGQTAPAPPAALNFPGQMAAPPGMGAYFQDRPASGRGNQNLMAQYAALRQLMRSS